MSPSPRDPLLTLPPLIVPPIKTHKTTLIILHGRGSTAENFAAPLLQHAVSSSDSKAVEEHAPSALGSRNFQDHFPNTKFVFPTAPLRRAVVFNRSLTHQWFDNWSLTQPELKQHLQVQGLRETSICLHKTLREEIQIVGAGNVGLMGVSQGCAVSLVAALLWSGEPFGAVVGMCGYLPFRKDMQECAGDHDDGNGDFMAGFENEEEDLFERDDGDVEEHSKIDKAIECLCEELQFDKEVGGRGNASPPLQSIPVFMGHGTDDEKVPRAFGKLTAEFLGGIDVEVTWKEYEGLGHWYSEDMLRDVIGFLRGLAGWGDGED